MSEVVVTVADIFSIAGEVIKFFCILCNSFFSALWNSCAMGKIVAVFGLLYIPQQVCKKINSYFYPKKRKSKKRKSKKKTTCDCSC